VEKLMAKHGFFECRACGPIGATSSNAADADQLPLARRVIERAPVPLVGYGATHHRIMVDGIQHGRLHSSLGAMASAEFPNRPRQGITPKLTYQRPENGQLLRTA